MPDLIATTDSIDELIRDVIDEAEAVLIDALFDELVRESISVTQAEQDRSDRVPMGAENSNPLVQRIPHSSVQGPIRSPPRR